MLSQKHIGVYFFLSFLNPVSPTVLRKSLTPKARVFFGQCQAQGVYQVLLGLKLQILSFLQQTVTSLSAQLSDYQLLLSTKLCEIFPEHVQLRVSSRSERDLCRLWSHVHNPHTHFFDNIPSLNFQVLGSCELPPLTRYKPMRLCLSLEFQILCATWTEEALISENIFCLKF